MSRASPSTLEPIKAIVREAGLRCTAARLAVMQHLVDTVGPRTHAEVAAALANRGFDRATIYRNLTELTEAKLVARVELGDHVWRFEVRRPHGAGAGGEDHPHFVCTTCGEVSCLDDVDVAITPKPGAAHRGAAGRRPAGKTGGKAAGKAAAAARRGGRPDGGVRSVTEVLLKGVCEQCS